MRRTRFHAEGDRLSMGLALGLSFVLGSRWLEAQPIPGPNINVTGGPAFLTLDPFEIVGNPWRNQEVEPHCAVDSRNPSVLVCSAVDYRLVDLPGGADGEHNDSWNMVAQSIDGGLTWVSRLVPGHPLDPTPNILSQYDFAADPIVQAGASGLFFHAGLVADRRDPKPGNGPPNAPGAIYVSTWINLNDQEDDLEPVKLVENGITLPATGNSGQFRDRPHLAVGEPNGKTCTLQVRRGDDSVVPQTIPATPAYLAFTTFVGPGANVKTQIHFMKSDDCGQSWSAMNKINDKTASINVGVQVVPVPGSRRILLFWRRGAQGKEGDALMFARSDDGGKNFGKAQVFAEICPFDQDTSPTTFRVTTVPSAVADGSRAYVVWADRRDPATGRCTSADGTLNDARVLVATTTDGLTRKGPFAVDRNARRGHQIFPSVSTAAGRVHLAWLDFRNDASGVFQELIDERPIVENDPSVLPPGLRQRHTADLYAAEAVAGPDLAFGPSERVSQYIHGKPEGSDDLEQLQWNVVNSRNFDRMNVAFFGDYNAVTSEGLVPRDPVSQPGVWSVNGSPGSPPTTPVFHRFWTDGRNLSLLSDESYALPRPYTPPDLNTALVEEALPPESLFDPTRMRPLCEPDATGTKNLDIYTSRSTHGFHAFAPWNNKAMLTPDRDPVQRAFVITVQNTVPAPIAPPAVTTRFRLTIVNQPLGNPGDGVPERASFEQFSFDTANGTTIPPTPVVEEEVTIPAGSAVARTVYVTSSDARAAVRVDVEKLDAAGAVEARRAIFLNPDPAAPPNLQLPGNVDPTAPEFDIQRFEVHGLEISDTGTPQDIGLTAGVPHQGAEDDSVNWGTPRWQNPRWQNPRWQNPRWQNPRWQNPRWQNPRWQNPRWQNYAVSADDAELGSRHIRTEYTNTGNTTSAYDARIIVNSLTTDRAFQLVVYKLYTATPMEGCEAAQVGYTQVLVNIPDYDVSLANLSQPDASREATFSLQPGETAFVELIVHPTAANPDVTTFDPAATPPVFIGTPQAVDTADVVPGQPVPEPEPEFSQLFIVAATLPAGTVGQPYPPTTLQALGGQPPFTWTIVDPQNFPPGLQLDSSSGVVSGIPTGAGMFDFTAQVTDGLQIALQMFHIDIAPPPSMTLVVANTSDAGAESLRQAILDANASPALDTIEFNISGPAPHTIALQSALPVITDPVVIDGTTQPGFAIGAPVVELDGTGAGAAQGLHITGGDSTVSGLVINRFSGNGILLESGGGNVIQQSFIGTDPSGALDLGNAGNGVQIIDSAGNTLGGPVASLRNVISGNGAEGVRIDGANATANVVRGNYIGIDGSGSADLGNGASGVYIRRAPGNSVIGNAISGNDTFAGVAICGDATFCGGFDAGTPGSNASGNVIQRNLIGTDATGSLALGNSGRGISIDGAPDTIVGGNAVERNVISANGLHGIVVFGNGPDGTQIAANHIGTDAAGTASLGNGGHGVSIAAGIGNRITANNIQSNGGLGIDLGGDGVVTANDVGDADGGANDLQNFPVLTAAVNDGVTLSVGTTFHSTPTTAFDIEYFASAVCDPSGNGEGRTSLGTSTFFTNPSGDASFNAVFGINLPAVGEFITATATGQLSGSTSEFSACQVVNTP